MRYPNLISRSLSAGVPPRRPRAARDVIRTVARARGGEGLTWGFTVIPLVGDTCRAMQPQVSLTSGRAHTRAAPGDAPGYHIYVCMWCFGTGSHVCHGVTWAWAGRTTSALYPQSIDRGVVDAQCYHTSTTSAGNMSAVYHPILTWGRCSHGPHLGTRPARVQPHLGTQ